jgi:hypothetical protein
MPAMSEDLPPTHMAAVGAEQRGTTWNTRRGITGSERVFVQ